MIMNVNEIIKSKENKQIKYLTKLMNNSKFSSQEKCFITFDLEVIKEAHTKGLLNSLYLCSALNKYNNEIIISEPLMKSINKKSDVIGVISYIFESEIIEDKIIYLDEIRDPINLAKIIYLMNKFNYKRLILSPKCVSIYNQKCLEEIGKDIFNIDVSYGDISLIKYLKNTGYKIYSTGLRNSKNLSSIKEFSNKFVLIFGNEARGVSQDILDISDEVIKIEMSNMESLNVAVAASIIFNSIK